MAREIDEVWIEQAIERYRRIEALQADFDKAVRGIAVTVRSPDGLVEVVVSGDGRTRDVTIAGALPGGTMWTFHGRSARPSPPRPTRRAGHGRSCTPRRSETTDRWASADERRRPGGWRAWCWRSFRG